jgi:hypothetical protein
MAPMQKLVLTLAVLWLWLWVTYLWTLYRHEREDRLRAKRAWNLKPRLPEDCPTCRLEKQGVMLEKQRTARAWSEVKSRRGRPKTHDTDGQACMEPSCEYYKDTDSTHHALRWDGTRNKNEATPSLECGVRHRPIDIVI